MGWSKGRKWIGIELGDHCYTHCEPRLHQVVDGTDQGGISKAVNWQGGSGYKFYELALTPPHNFIFAFKALKIRRYVK